MYPRNVLTEHEDNAYFGFTLSAFSHFSLPFMGIRVCILRVASA